MINIDIYVFCLLFFDFFTQFYSNPSFYWFSYCKDVFGNDGNVVKFMQIYGKFFQILFFQHWFHFFSPYYSEPKNKEVRIVILANSSKSSTGNPTIKMMLCGLPDPSVRNLCVLIFLVLVRVFIVYLLSQIVRE